MIRREQREVRRKNEEEAGWGCSERGQKPSLSGGDI